MIFESLISRVNLGMNGNEEVCLRLILMRDCFAVVGCLLNLSLIRFELLKSRVKQSYFKRVSGMYLKYVEWGRNFPIFIQEIKLNVVLR